MANANLIGKKVYGVSGPSERPKEGLAGREGFIKSIGNSSIVGPQIIVKWNEGNEEPFAPHIVKPTSEFSGIGVYYEESEVNLLDLESTGIH